MRRRADILRLVGFFILCLRCSPDRDGAPSNLRLHGMKHRSVLIVDDSATMRRAVRRLFETSGWHVVGEAENGKQGVQMAEALQPAVVTLDVAMPVMHGIDAAKQLIAETPHIQSSCVPRMAMMGYREPSAERPPDRDFEVRRRQLLVPTAEKLSLVMAFLLGTL